MRNYNDSSARDTAARLLSLVNRVTILREKEPSDALKLLAGAAECIINGDCMGAYIKHCALCRALIKSPARRVSGSIFTDYLIHLAVGYEHSFALSSATGMLDEAQLMLFRSDLSALGELSTLDSAAISRMTIQRSRELNSRSRYAKDDISVMSTAAWGGTEPKPMPHNKEAMPAEAALQPPAEGEWPAWSYGEKGMRGEYAADEVLEEIYISLTESDNWKSAAQDLFNLFASSGTGVLLRSRTLECRTDGQRAWLEEAAQNECAVQLSCQEKARQTLSEQVIAFMRGTKPSCVLIYGPEAMGKATLARAMADEFPELRLIQACPVNGAEIRSLFAYLGAQPLRFMLLMENADTYSPAWRALLNECTGAAVPQNVMCVATSSSSAGFAGFPVRIGLENMELDAFAKTAEELSAARAPYIDTDAAWIRNAAVDYQLDPHDEFNVSSASLIAVRFIAAHE